MPRSRPLFVLFLMFPLWGTLLAFVALGYMPGLLHGFVVALGAYAHIEWAARMGRMNEGDPLRKVFASFAFFAMGCVACALVWWLAAWLVGSPW